MDQRHGEVFVTNAAGEVDSVWKVSLKEDEKVCKPQSYTSGWVVHKVKLKIEAVEVSRFVDSTTIYRHMDCLGYSLSPREVRFILLPIVTIRE